MPGRIPRKCAKPGCPVIGVFDGPYCGDHKRASRAQGQRPLKSLYDSRAYRDKFQKRVIFNNPICARIVNGERCRRPSTVVHHLKDPRTIDELYAPANIVALCAACHPGGAPGTPDWKAGVDYVPTEWPLPTGTGE